MTDTKFFELCKLASSLAEQHAKLVLVLEEEYKERFGNYPSEVDDDFWIDSIHQGQANFTLDQIISEAKLHVK